MTGKHTTEHKPPPTRPEGGLLAESRELPRSKWRPYHHRVNGYQKTIDRFLERFPVEIRREKRYALVELARGPYVNCVDVDAGLTPEQWIEAAVPQELEDREAVVEVMVAIACLHWEPLRYSRSDWHCSLRSESRAERAEKIEKRLAGGRYVRHSWRERVPVHFLPRAEDEALKVWRAVSTRMRISPHAFGHDDKHVGYVHDNLCLERFGLTADEPFSPIEWGSAQQATDLHHKCSGCGEPIAPIAFKHSPRLPLSWLDWSNQNTPALREREDDEFYKNRDWQHERAVRAVSEEKWCGKPECEQVIHLHQLAPGDTLARVDGQARWYVYALYDPRNMTPFYIGKGCGNRMNHHMREHSDVQRRINEFKHARIAEIVAAGYQPIPQRLAFFWQERDAFAHESELITSTRGLTNIVHNMHDPAAAASLRRLAG